MIKGVFFDFDGTIANDLGFFIKAYKKTYQSFNLVLKEKEIIANFNLKTADICKKYQIKSHKLFLEKYLTNVGEIFIKVQLFPHFKKIIFFLRKRGVKIAIVSFALRNYLEMMIDRLKINESFDVLIGFDDVKNSKPNPEPVFLACQKLALKPKEVLIIGDASSDIMMGKNAKIKTALFFPKENIRIYGKNHPAQDLADYVISDLAQIRKITEE